MTYPGRRPPSPHAPHPIPDFSARARILHALFRALPESQAMALRVAVVRHGGALSAGVGLNWGELRTWAPRDPAALATYLARHPQSAYSALCFDRE